MIHGTIFADFSGGPGSDQDLQALADEVRTHGLHRLHPLLRSLVERVQAPLVQLVDELKVERDRLKGRVAELTTERDEARAAALSDTLALVVVQELTRERDQLKARVAELEAPPVVPEGWELRKIGAPEWRKWEARRDGKMSWCGYAGDLPVIRALAYAIEKDQSPEIGR